MGWTIFFLIVIGFSLYKWRWKAAAVLLCLYLIYPFSFWSYKLTLVVETPEGIKTGSAVRWVYSSIMPTILPEEREVQTGVKGEAVVVDLGQRGVLFALLKGKDSSDYGYNIIYREFPHNGGKRERMQYYTFLKDKKELTFDKIPLLVRFRDINDPKTVEQVDPNDLEKSFGNGVRLVSATLEMTDEDITKGVVEKWLPWFAKWKNYGGNVVGRASFYNPPPPTEAELSTSMDFIQE